MKLPTGEAPASLVSDVVRSIAPPAAACPERVRLRLDGLTKPPGSLGRLEELAVRLATIYGDPPPSLRRRLVLVLAADHGVSRRGVSAYPRDVTAQMCRNIRAGGAAINALASAVCAAVEVVDLGVDADAGSLAGVLDRRVRRGSRDLAAGPALRMEEVDRAVMAGVELVQDRAADVDVFGLGEMGIGNTTAASAVTAALTPRLAVQVVGRGTGVDGPRLAAKRAAVAEALRRLPAEPSPLRVLAEVGGLEIAGLVGVVLGCARAGRAAVLDGFVSTCAGLVAARLCPAARGVLFASHLSPEPGHAIQLRSLGLAPILDLEMRLGEGTGAALALPVLEAAGAVLRGMASFDAAGVSGPEPAATPERTRCG